MILIQMNWFKFFRLKSLLISLVSCFGLAACGQNLIQDRAPSSVQNEVLQKKVETFTQQIHQGLTLKEDLVLAEYLKHLALKLMQIDASDKKKAQLVKVELLKEDIWYSTSLPKFSFYLSWNALQKLEFENEVAALIAIQLGHLNLEQFQHRIDATKVKTASALPPLVSFRDILTFSPEEETAAFKEAVRVLYEAGYDARGLVSLLTYYEKNIKSSPLDQETIAKLKEETRREIAVLTPLRNPIVRSQSFLMIRKRFQRL